MALRPLSGQREVRLDAGRQQGPDDGHVWHDARLEPSGPPVELGSSLWTHTSVAAIGTRIAVSHAVPDGAVLVQIEGASVVNSTLLRGGGKRGLPV